MSKDYPFYIQQDGETIVSGEDYLAVIYNNLMGFNFTGKEYTKYLACMSQGDFVGVTVDPAKLVTNLPICNVCKRASRPEFIAQHEAKCVDQKEQA